MITHRSQRPGLTNMALLCCPASSRPLSPPPLFPWPPPLSSSLPLPPPRGIGPLQEGLGIPTIQPEGLGIFNHSAVASPGGPEKGFPLGLLDRSGAYSGLAAWADARPARTRDMGPVDEPGVLPCSLSLWILDSGVSDSRPFREGAGAASSPDGLVTPAGRRAVADFFSPPPKEGSETGGG